MRSGQKCFCCKSNFCGKTRFFNFFQKKTKRDFPRTSKNSDFFEKGYDDRSLSFFKKKKSDHRKSEKKFKEGFVGQVVFAFKKRGNQKRDETKKNDRTKKVLQRDNQFKNE